MGRREAPTLGNQTRILGLEALYQAAGSEKVEALPEGSYPIQLHRREVEEEKAMAADPRHIPLPTVAGRLEVVAGIEVVGCGLHPLEWPEEQPKSGRTRQQHQQHPPAKRRKRHTTEIVLGREPKYQIDHQHNGCPENG